jgi:hypothetical protein
MSMLWTSDLFDIPSIIGQIISVFEILHRYRESAVRERARSLYLGGLGLSGKG